MIHQEYSRILPDSKTVVVFIHGIVGTPNHFKDLVPLVPEEFSVCNMLLDGHGKGVKEFAKTSMKKWKNQVHEKIAELSETHENILIVAHSMGTLFAIKEALSNPKIKELFLLAVPFKVGIKPAMFSNSMMLYLGGSKKDNPRIAAQKNAYGVENDLRFWRYIGWIPRYLELFGEIRRVRPLAKQIPIPCQAFQSRKDEVVSRSAMKYLQENPRISARFLEGSTHCYYAPQAWEELLCAFEKTMAQAKDY